MTLLFHFPLFYTAFILLGFLAVTIAYIGRFSCMPVQIVKGVAFLTGAFLLYGYIGEPKGVLRGYAFKIVYQQAVEQKGELSLNTRKLAELIKDYPDVQKEVISLLAVDDYLHKRYKQAMGYWQFLLESDASLPFNRRQALQRAIHVAQQHLSEQDRSQA